MRFILQNNGAALKMVQVDTVEEIEMFKMQCSASEWSFRAKRMIEESYQRHGEFALSGLWKRILDIKKISGKNIYIDGFTDPETGLVDLSINKELLDEFIDSNEFKFAPYWYQFESVLQALKFKRSRTEVATAGGKSFSIFLYIRFLYQYNKINTDKKVLIITIRKMLVNQMISDIKNYQTDDFLKCDSIFSGGKQLENSNVVVGTYQSLSDMDKEYFDQFSAVIIDECHSAKIKSIKDDIIPKLNFEHCKYIWGLSGTHPPDKTIDDLTLEAYIGPIMFKITASELQEIGTIADIRINVIWLHYPKEKTKEFWELEEMDKNLPAVTQLKCERHWLHYNPDRNRIILNIVNSFKGNQIILVDSVAYCNYLTEIINESGVKTCRIIHGGVKDSDREEIKIELEDEENIVLVATWETMSTGVSVNNIMAVHFPDGGRSRYRIRQSLGRGLRLHKDKDYLVAFDYADIIHKDPNWPGHHTNRLRNQAKGRIKIYEEQEFPYKEIHYNL